MRASTPAAQDPHLQLFLVLLGGGRDLIVEVHDADALCRCNVGRMSGCIAGRGGISQQRAWQAAAKKSSRLLVASHAPPSETRTWKAPAMVAGPAMSSVVGAICTLRMRHTFVLCMPESTPVSQSGPATSMHSCISQERA